jgi:hypothetical protein
MAALISYVSLLSKLSSVHGFYMFIPPFDCFHFIILLSDSLIVFVNLNLYVYFILNMLIQISFIIIIIVVVLKVHYDIYKSSYNISYLNSPSPFSFIPFPPFLE